MNSSCLQFFCLQITDAFSLDASSFGEAETPTAMSDRLSEEIVRILAAPYTASLEVRFSRNPPTTTAHPALTFLGNVVWTSSQDLNAALESVERWEVLEWASSHPCQIAPVAEVTINSIWRCPFAYSIIGHLGTCPRIVCVESMAYWMAFLPRRQCRASSARVAETRTLLDRSAPGAGPQRRRQIGQCESSLSFLSLFRQS